MESGGLVGEILNDRSLNLGKFQGAEEATLDRLEERGQIAFRYAGGNPNGSARDIAGIFNETKNILGMMPHPENAIDPLQGSTDGAPLFSGLVQALS